MVGNDVVDLADPETQPETLHPRFDARVFTAAERRLVAASASQSTMRWLLWAAKESAYKLVKRQRPATLFAPVSFEVAMGRWPEVTVSHAQRTVYGRIESAGDALHAVVTLDRSGLQRLVSAIGAAAQSPRDAVRDLARHHLARVLSCPPNELEIVAGADRIPRLSRRGDPLPGSLSLSHHGRFVAFAYHPGRRRALLDGAVPAR